MKTSHHYYTNQTPHRQGLGAITKAIASLAMCSMIVIPAGGCSNRDNNFIYGSEKESVSTFINPSIPDSVELCGKYIDLDREDMYERFDRELTSLVFGHSNTLLTIKRANRYFPEIAPILQKNKVPLDLLYLACVESNLNVRAYSPSHAAGFWQFLAATAREYGLEVSDEVDERYHIAKSTEAACKYLKSAYAKYGDWPTAMASYNAGRARISGELSKQLVNNSFDLFLTEETSRYVFRIMAMKMVLENPRVYGFRLSPTQLYNPVECDEVAVNGAVESWPQWAIDHGINFQILRDLNPWIRDKKLTNKDGKTYYVKIPKKDAIKRSVANHRIYNHNWVTE